MRDVAPELDVVIKLFDFEKELGEISAGLQGSKEGKLDTKKYELARKGYYDLRTFKRGEELLTEIKDYLEKNKENFGEYYYGLGVNIIGNWIDYLESEINVKCAKKYPWIYCDAFDGKVYRKFIEKLRAKGIKCGFIEEDEVKVSFVRVLESLRNCLHTIGIEISNAVEESKEIEEKTKGICKVVKLGKMKDEVFEICEIFAENVAKNSDLYYSGDVGKQKGIIYGDEIQFKIGGAVGHASVLDLKKGEFRYEDHHEVRLHAVKEALESMGLLCESRGNTLVCKGVDLEDSRKIARLLAFLPSLDIRIDDLIEEYVDELMDTCVEKCIRVHSKEFKKECEEMGYEDDTIDYCIREKCENEICAPELEEEARNELKIISAEALERAMEDEECSYEDVVDFIRFEMESIIEGLKLEEEDYY